MKQKLLLIGALVLVLGPASVGASAGPGYTVDWYRVGDMSGGVSHNAQYRVTGTLSQMTAGKMSNAEFTLCGGIQCMPPVARVIHNYYFPILQKS